MNLRNITGIAMCLVSFQLSACFQTASSEPPAEVVAVSEDSVPAASEEVKLETDTIPVIAQEVTLPDTGDLERRLIGAGLMNVQEVDPGIQVELRYATVNNFLGKNVYGNLRRCYLQPVVARMLGKAQQRLRKNFPGLNLRVYDGTRPRAVQYQMWEIVKGTDQQQYVASPRSGSMHNYGASVDLTVADDEGIALDMGTSFDFFGDLAQPRYEAKFVASGELTEEQVHNRRILRSAMLGAGFHGILSEWWHFNAASRDSIKKTYRPVE